jgi:hypothetical protein
MTRLPLASESHRSWPRHSRGLVLGGLWLRCRTWRRALALDHALANGADPSAGDELSLRAGQLRSLKNRTRIARSLEAAVELTERPPPTGALPPMVRRREVWGCRGYLLQLAERITHGSVLNVQGLAICSELVRDGGSPLFYEHAPRSLASTVHSALTALQQPSHASIKRSSGPPRAGEDAPA